MQRATATQGVSDHALLDLVSGPGSPAALAELFDRHGAAVHRLLKLVSADTEDVDPLVADVFVTLSRRSGRLEDDVENVRLGLLAMAWRRSALAAAAAAGAPAAPTGAEWARGDEAALSRLRCLPSGNRDALALTVLAAATVTEVAAVLHVNRRAVAAELRAGLHSASVTRHPTGA